MTLTAEHAQTAKLSDAFTKFDIGSSAGHVCRDRYGTLLTCLGNDLSFSGIVLGIQHFMTDLLLFQHVTDQFRCLNGDRTDKHRLSLLMSFNDFIDQGFKLCLLGSVYSIRIVNSGNRTVGRDLIHQHVIDLTEFFFLGLCGTGHTGQLVVQTEEVLVGDRCQDSRFLFDRNAFLGTYSLMQTVRPLSALHQTSGIGIDDDDLITFLVHDIFNISGHDIVCLQCLMDPVQKLCMFKIIQILDMESLLGQGYTLLGQLYRTSLDIDLIVFIVLQTFDKPVCLQVEIGCLPHTAGNDQRCT